MAPHHGAEHFPVSNEEAQLQNKMEVMDRMPLRERFPNRAELVAHPDSAEEGLARGEICNGKMCPLVLQAFHLADRGGLSHYGFVDMSDTKYRGMQTTKNKP